MGRQKLLNQAARATSNWIQKSSGVMVPAGRQGNHVAIITGIGGVLGREFRNTFVSDSDNLYVVGGTRRPLTEEQKRENERYQGDYRLEQMDYTPDGIAKTLHALSEQIGDVDHITWINTIGGGHPDEKSGESYEDLNLKPVEAACEGLKKFRETTGKHVSMIHLSSHTVAVTPEGVDPGYTDSRIKAEEAVQKSGVQGHILRLGVVINSGELTDKGMVYNTNYEFSPENLANSPIAATLGQHDMPMQYVHAADVAKASLNLVKEGFQGQMGVTNAVAGVSTQGEVYDFHAKKMGKSGEAAEVPLPIVDLAVGITGGMGRLTPYATAMAASDGASLAMGNEKRFMNPEPFRKLLGGDKPTTLSDVFQGTEVVHFPPDSIPKFAAKVMSASMDPNKMQKAIDEIRDHGGVYNLAINLLHMSSAIVTSKYKKPEVPLGEDSEFRKELKERRVRDQSYDDKIPTIDAPGKKEVARSRLGRKNIETETPHQDSTTVYMSNPVARKDSEVEAKEQESLPSRKGTIVVIGGKSQLGSSVVKKFMTEGYNIVSTTRKPKSSINEGSRYHEVGGIDLENPETGNQEFWEEVFDDIEKHQGKIKAVVNCAGEALGQNEDSLYNINKRPVKPMLDAAVKKGIKQFTYISTKGAGVEESFEEGNYSKTKRDAELDILNAGDTGDTNTTIIRPDLLISGNNPGHFGGPQIMSSSPIKFMAGASAEKAGNTRLSPVSTHDVSDLIYNVVDQDKKTPEVLTASGPQEFSYSDLLNFFKNFRGDKFLVGLQVPADAVMPFAEAAPKGALEPNHIKLLKIMDEMEVDPAKQQAEEKSVEAFKEILGRPRVTIGEEMASVSRPNLGDAQMLGYFASVLKNVDADNAQQMMAGFVAGATQSRIVFDANKSQDERTEHDGINTGNLLLGIAAGAAAIGIYNKMRSKNKEGSEEKGKSSEPLIDISSIKTNPEAFESAINANSPEAIQLVQQETDIAAVVASQTKLDVKDIIARANLSGEKAAQFEEMVLKSQKSEGAEKQQASRMPAEPDAKGPKKHTDGVKRKESYKDKVASEKAEKDSSERNIN